VIAAGDEGVTRGVAIGVATGRGVVTAGGGEMRCGMIRFGPSCVTGGRAVSDSGATVGVGKTVRGGGVTRLTGGNVGGDFNSGSVALDGGAVGAGVGAATGGGILR
jgi:hypothetical protein